MKPKILVVEDDPEIANILTYLLEHDGYDITLLTDGRDAYKLITKEPAEGDPGPPDVALLDIMLPHVDGIQLCTAIKASPVWKNVPVVILTAKTQDFTVSFAMRAGADDYIIKPFSPTDVLTRLKSVRGLSAE